MRLGSSLRNQGANVISLVQGEPDFDTPGHIVAAATQALQRGETHYVEGEGLLDLRIAIAEKAKRENGVDSDPTSEVLVTTGATLGVYLALMAVTNPGDEVLLFDPGYGPYAAMVGLVDAQPVAVPLASRAGHFSLDPERVRERVTRRTRAIIVNSPHNPTGMVLGAVDLEAIASIALEHDLIVIADEVYEKLVFDGAEHVSIASLSNEVKARTIVVNSFSKTYAMTGWRLGYNLAAADLTRAMSDVLYQTARCAPSFTQRAGIAALTGPQDGVEEMVRMYAGRRRLMGDLLSALPEFEFNLPQGTFYCFPDCSRIQRESWSLARRLISEKYVMVTPGAYYGERGEGHLRLSFACSTDDIREGMSRVGSYLAADCRPQPATKR
jgi:aspartate aminotransferase